MTGHALTPVRWSTSSTSHPLPIPAHDLSALRAHFEACTGCKGRWFVIRCGVEALHAFVAPRFVTTLVAVAGMATVVAAAAAAL